jgi:hypothetical protein
MVVRRLGTDWTRAPVLNLCPGPRERSSGKTTAALNLGHGQALASEVPAQ